MGRDADSVADGSAGDGRYGGLHRGRSLGRSGAAGFGAADLRKQLQEGDLVERLWGDGTNGFYKEFSTASACNRNKSDVDSVSAGDCYLLLVESQIRALAI